MLNYTLSLQETVSIQKEIASFAEEEMFGHGFLVSQCYWFQILDPGVKLQQRQVLLATYIQF